MLLLIVTNEKVGELAYDGAAGTELYPSLFHGGELGILDSASDVGILENSSDFQTSLLDVFLDQILALFDILILVFPFEESADLISGVGRFGYIQPVHGGTGRIG